MKETFTSGIIGGLCAALPLWSNCSVLETIMIGFAIAYVAFEMQTGVLLGGKE